MRTVKTFRKLGQDEEGHSTSFETHKYPGDLGTGQLALRGLDVEEAGEGRRQGLFKFQPPVPCLLSPKGCLAAGTLSSTLSSVQPSCPACSGPALF